MIDPIPAGYTTLPEAVERLVANISDRDFEVALSEFRRLREIFGRPLPEAKLKENDIDFDVQSRKESVSGWHKRELAVHKLRLSLEEGTLIAFVRNPESGELFRLEPADWRGAAFWYAIIRGGVIHSSACEYIERHDGRRVLMETVALDNWFMRAKDRKTRAADEDCLGWLEREMRASPDQNARPKNDWFREAKEKFGVSERAFNRHWASAILSTKSRWGAKGRKSAQ